MSQDNAYTPSPAITGFAQIKPGFQLSSSGSLLFQGTALNAQLLDNLDSTDFIRANIAATTSGTL
jgi:hypothetical protein